MFIALRENHSSLAGQRHRSCHALRETDVRCSQRQQTLRSGTLAQWVSGIQWGDSASIESQTISRRLNRVPFLRSGHKKGNGILWVSRNKKWHIKGGKSNSTKGTTRHIMKTGLLPPPRSLTKRSGLTRKSSKLVCEWSKAPRSHESATPANHLLFLPLASLFWYSLSPKWIELPRGKGGQPIAQVENDKLRQCLEI